MITSTNPQITRRTLLAAGTAVPLCRCAAFSPGAPPPPRRSAADRSALSQPT